MQQYVKAQKWLARHAEGVRFYATLAFMPLADFKRLADKRFGNNQEAKRRALISDFGQDLGLAINEVDRVANSQPASRDI